MSYDIKWCVRCEVPDSEGDPYVVVQVPEYDSPTYNLRPMFVAAMEWDYDQGTYYPMAEALEHVRLGLSRLERDPESYRKYEPENHWGTVESAIRCMRSWVDELTPTTDGWHDWDKAVDRWPIEALWWRW